MIEEIKSAVRKIKAFDIASIFVRHDLPQGFLNLNYLGVLPILAWPIVLFGSLLLFDDPKNESWAYRFLWTALFYPFAYIANMLLSFWLYHRVRILAYILPLLSILFSITVFYTTFY
jgi:hypothetical protein